MRKNLIKTLTFACVFVCGYVVAGPESEPAPVQSASARGRDVALYAMKLIGTPYRFGGKNPESGFDCSGMVSYVFHQVAGMKMGGSAADIARLGRPVKRENLQSGDLVFFNTRNAPFSHVGIYIGDDRFIHAPSSSGQVRIDRMSSRYFDPRFSAARTYF